MDVLSTCRLPVVVVPWQSHTGRWMLTVIARATLDLTPIVCALSDTQDAIQEGDAHLDDDPARSLQAADDLAPLKPRADVTLVGSAFAPRSEPAQSIVARLSVGDLDKSVEAFGDRFAGPDGSVAHGPPLLRMPLVYERAAGGPETWNPVGINAGARDAYGRAPLPNLAPPGLAPGQPIPTAGFGPIAASWALRRQKLGRHAASFPADLRRSALPPDIDAGYFNAAPPDQQLPAIRGDEAIVLENLHPRLRRLTTCLPGLTPYAIVEAPHGSQRLDLRCDTLAFDADRWTCTLTYRAQIPVDEPDPPGRIRLVLDEPVAAQERDQTLAVDPSAHRPSAGVLPFAGPPALSPPRPPPVPPPVLVPPPAPQAAPPALGRPAPLPPMPAPVPAPPPFIPPRPGLRIEPPSLLGPLDPVARPRSDMPALGATDVPVPAAEGTPSVAEPATIAPAAPSGLAEGEALDLVWLSSESVPRIRRRKIFRAVLDTLEETPIDPELDDPTRSASPAAIEDRRDVAAILTRGDPVAPDALARVMEEGIAGGTFHAKIALVAGELAFSFDEVKLLEAWVSALTPLAGEDERLRATLRQATDFLATRGAASLPAVAEGLSAQIREVLRQGRRPVASVEGMTAHVERSALEQRAYARRTVFGAPHVRALLSGGVPVYVPEAVAAGLPLMTRFRARVLGEVHPQADQGEAHAVALRAVALGRAVSLRPPSAKR